MATKSKIFWVSWVQPGEDHRPLTFPPNRNIMGWWCSGESDSGSTLCAVVKATTKKVAELAVYQDWPEAEKSEWRFFDEKESGFSPSDRFPLSDWMKDRFDSPLT